MQRGHPYPMQQLFPNASRIEALRIFKFFFVPFYLFLPLLSLFIFTLLAQARAHTFTMTHNSLGIRAIIRRIRRSKEGGSWSWNCKQDISSIDHQTSQSQSSPSPHPPITISEFIERINYFVTRDKHVKTNFGNAGFTRLLVEFTGGLLVLIRLHVELCTGGIEIESESSGLKSLQAAQICRVSAKEPSRYPLLNYRVHDAMVLVDKVEFNRGTVNRETTPWNTGKNSKLSKYWIISLRYIPARITEERIVPNVKEKRLLFLFSWQ